LLAQPCRKLAQRQVVLGRRGEHICDNVSEKDGGGFDEASLPLTGASEDEQQLALPCGRNFGDRLFDRT
jgi:hypothetical protein